MGSQKVTNSSQITLFFKIKIKNLSHIYRLQEGGIKLAIRKFDSLAELSANWNLIMNCTGFGARSLCNDKRLVSIRGQVIKV